MTFAAFLFFAAELLAVSIALAIPATRCSVARAVHAGVALLSCCHIVVRTCVLMYLS